MSLSDALIVYPAIFALLLGLELLYFRVAERFGVVDRPNERSSHTRVTLRGGGVVFVLALIVFEIWSGFRYPWFFAGALLVAGVSFLDDLLTLSSKVRLPVQVLGLALLFLDTAVFAQPFGWVLLALVVATGVANVFNFMDGVNGITGFYGLVTLLTLLYLNQTVAFADPRLILVVVLGVLVFGLFNFRREARCFAGDIGSLSLAFVVIFLLARLILASGSPYFILLLAVYGIDGGFTILQRLARGENILEAHRSHLYQWLVKPGPLAHLQVAGLYAVLQLAVNLLVIFTWQGNDLQQLLWTGFTLGSLSLIYLYVKNHLAQRYRLS